MGDRRDAEKIYKFAFIFSTLPIKGATGSSGKHLLGRPGLRIKIDAAYDDYRRLLPRHSRTKSQHRYNSVD